ncbi:hypothetical protein GCM10010954_15730 [Halobacillus andaensis]|uniref:Uncharacterized protein n=1 Tax=Halobacillus andaensis TaxID=1176239 RepID=A0A917B1Z4_HALAA|nr:hypothetical protein [Halobacillus andaensis]MBP2004927.1 hypothetical protein [Halobacillus andaensis]GGF17831.1 hypothetical protein GCM10010954_15730 [Halobacillus andaensis]
MKRKWWFILLALLLAISIGVNVYQYQSHQEDLVEAKSTDLTAIRGLMTELAVRIGDEDASAQEIEALAFSLNRLTSDLSSSEHLYPGDTRDYDFYQKTSRTLMTFVNNNDVTEMSIQQRDVVFQTIMSGVGSKDSDFIEQQLAEFTQSE